MELLNKLQSNEVWLDFLAYRKQSHRLSEQEEADLRRFINDEAYLPIVADIRAGAPFPHPRKARISKKSTSKKRTVYVYPEPGAQVLKLLTHLLLRKYDGLFCRNLYSFRAGHGVKEAVRDLTSIAAVRDMYSYKADVSNFFNSIPVERMIPMVERALSDEPEIAAFIVSLLRDPMVWEGTSLIREEKGIMAGCPLSTFLANLYLSELDRVFWENRWIYARYSDDIILFAPTAEALEDRVALVRRTLEERGLAINPEKESRTAPGEAWVFLGVCYDNGTVDVAPVSVEKMKAKMRRKTRALKRWADRKGLSGEKAAKAFVRAFNRKLFENPISNDLTWARWFFPLITTDRSLKVIDQYAQQSIRTLATGTHTKAAYNFRYEQMKALGYVTLVNRYYSFSSEEAPEE